MKGPSCLVPAVSITLLFLLLFRTHAAASPAQIGVFRPSTGQWYFDYSGNQAWDRCGPDGCLGQFGASTDLPIAGDWTGNGVPKIGVFRPADGRWYLDLNGNSFWDGCGTDGCFGPFGAPVDRPVIGDWDGTGALRFGVFRPTTGQWYFDLNGNGTWDGCGTDGCSGPFGAPEDLPVAGDMDGDTVAEFGVYRPSTGMWYFDLDHNGVWSGCGADGCFGPFGAPEDQPVMADINGDGQLEFGVFRPSTSQWYFDLDHNGIWSGCGADGCFGGFGGLGDLPVAGSWDRYVGPGDPLNYLPISQGSTWTYQGTYSDSDGFSLNYQNTATVSGTRLIDGVTTTVVSINNPGGDGPFEEYLLKDGRGITNWGNNDPFDTITPLVAAYQEIIFPISTGAGFKQFELGGVDLGEDLDGDWINERVNMSSQITVAGFENVSVPAGFFSSCAKVVNTISISGNLSSLPSLTFNGTSTTTTWYAPGTGPVKLENYTLMTASNGASFSSFVAESLASSDVIPSQVVGTPVQIGTGQSPRLAVAANGDAMIVWPYQDSVWASRYTTTGGWTTPALVENQAGVARIPVVAIDPDGFATAAWHDMIDNNLWANRYTPGSGWGAPEVVDVDAGAVADPVIAADPDGNVTLVWKKIEGSTRSLWARHYAPGTGWGPSVRIEPLGGWADNQKLVVDASGNAIAVWFEQTSGLFYDVWANRYIFGVGWGTPELIEWNTGEPLMNSLAIDVNSGGTAVVTWVQREGLYMSLWSNRYSPGDGWGAPSLVEGNPYDTFIPDVAIAEDGSVMAVWLQSDENLQRIWANRYQPGTGWGTPVSIQNNLGNAGADGKVIFDANGIATASWTQSDGDQWSLWGNRYNPATGWNTAQRLEANGETAYGPQLGIDAAGNVTVAWYHWISTDWTVWANRF